MTSIQRIALGIEYDGSQLHGWQIQPDRPSVQSSIEQAIFTFTQQKTHVHAAGRTDRGVHAIEQVAHFDTHAIRPPFAWVRALNTLLSRQGREDIRILWAQDVDSGFHARFLAIARTYIYKLYVGTVQPACFRHSMGFCLSPTDFDSQAMQNAAQYLIGMHDFSSFRSSECQAKSPIKHMHYIDIVDQAPYYTITLKANAFLHHMVRNIMAALLVVGKGKQASAWMQSLLEAKSRQMCPPTFTPYGLYLAKIDYEDHWGLDRTDNALLKYMLRT